MLKIAVFGPIPSASALMTASENPGAFSSIRTANRRSDHRTLMTLREQANGWPTKISLNSRHLAIRESCAMFDFGTGTREVEQNFRRAYTRAALSENCS